MGEPIEVFISYVYEDIRFLEELKKHLEPLKRQGLIRAWSDANITAGTEWKKTRDEHLGKAQVFLLLISPDFMASDFCYAVEMQRAVKRHDRGDARVIPIILRATDNWTDAPFGKLQVLPKGAKPIKQWLDRDRAFVSVTKGIREAITQLTAQPQEMDQTPRKEPGTRVSPDSRNTGKRETTRASRPHQEHPNKKPHILIIEDERTWQNLLRDILEDLMGCHADITADLATAKQRWDAPTHYDLALIDVCLDQEEFTLSCQQLFAYFHATHPEVPLVAITGKPVTPHNAFTLSKEYEVVDYIEKGKDDLPDIQQCIARYLGKVQGSTMERGGGDKSRHVRRKRTHPV